ncbi:MAG: ATP synthase F1 subunit delta [Candidatus Nealsonbacteria bacterium]|nr:ATP synthase F1 subunit delta [Candidatus Nealsonbacteria bacterium]
MKKITPLQYAIFLYELTSQGANITKQINEFLGVLAKNNDLSKIREVINDFEKYEKRQRGAQDVEIISATPLAKDLRTQILSAIGGKIDVKETVNPELLGGAIVTVGDTMIDGSLRRKLKELSKVLIYG